jgi:hypothetical protein
VFDSSAAIAVLVTGVQASGKSVVGRLLAGRFDRAAFIDGDTVWKFIVAGAEDMGPDPSPDALRQLELRYRNTAMLATAYRDAGFTAVCADNVYGLDITRYADWLGRPAAVVVLRPSVEAVVERYGERGGAAYRGWDEAGIATAVRQFDTWLASATPAGLWLDTTQLSPAETVDAILSRWDEALLR